MYDIFELLHLDTKEDIYTFCLAEFLNCPDYRKRVATLWGFSENEDYDITRKAIELDGKTSNIRNKIIPDLILHNNNHIAVIESKMYSSEGYGQTGDYEGAKTIIKSNLKRESVSDENIEFYYFTLAGIGASSTMFKIVRWADYYKETLENFHFDNNNELEILGQAIFKRATEYLDYLINWEAKKYKEFTDNANSWITPYSLFQRGDKNDIWGLNFIKYGINSGKVQGKGHSTYRTDIWKNEYNLCNASFSKNTEKEIVSNDNIRIFSRIEWETNNVNVIMNIEYWYLEKDELVGYIPYSKLPVKIQNKSCENRKRIWKYLEDIYISEYKFRIPSKKKNSLHMCINEINKTQNQSMKQVIDSIKIILKKLEEYEDYIASNIIIGEDGLLTFNYD